MEINNAAIIQNSNQMFQIIQQAQAAQTDMAEDIAVLAITEKTKSDAAAAIFGLGQNIDIVS